MSITCIRKISKFFSSLYIKYEIIIVNDDSKDKTLELIKNEIKKYPSFENIKNRPEIIGVSYDKSSGKRFAVKTGIQYIWGKYVLMLDSDGATDIKDYNLLLFKSVKDEELRLAIGNKKLFLNKPSVNGIEIIWELLIILSLILYWSKRNKTYIMITRRKHHISLKLQKYSTKHSILLFH